MVVSTQLMPPLQFVSKPPRRPIRRLLQGAAVAAAALVWFASSAAGSTTAGGSSVVVQPGQSLWAIAEQYPGGQDLRSRIDELISVNHLSPAGDLSAGQELFVPES
jgi:hypothetical protein